MAKRAIFEADSSSGVATVRVSSSPTGRQFTVEPAVDSNGASTATGSVSVQFRSPDSDFYEDVVDSSGSALSLSIASGSVTRLIDGHFTHLRVTSTQSSDVFTVKVR